MTPIFKRELIYSLPEEIIREHILPYSYNRIPKNLNVDIRSFYTDYNLISSYYITFFNYKILLNDLIIYCNGENELPIYEISERYKKIVKRHNRLSNKTNKQLIEYFMCYFHITPKKQNIWFLLGLLTPLERTEFINNFILIEENM